MRNNRIKPIAIIPARGGSKRIPRKNITKIFGKPAIGILIEKLNEFDIFQEIIVSTDDKEIAQIAEYYGARALPRSAPELSNDLTASEDVIRDAIKILDLENSFIPIFCIYPLSILIKREYLAEAIEKLEPKPEQFVISGGVMNPNPLRHTFVCEGDSIKAIFPENNCKRSQDLEEVYFDSGMFYLAYPKIWNDEEKYWYHNNASMVLVDQEDALDVDSVEDLAKLLDVAEKKLKQHSDTD